MRVKIKIPKKVWIGVLTFLATAGIFYGVFEMTRGTRATSTGDVVYVAGHHNETAYGTGWKTSMYHVDYYDTSTGGSGGNITQRAMCLDAAANSPIGGIGGAQVRTASAFRQPIQNMLVFDQSYNPTVSSAFQSAYGADINNALSGIGLSGISDMNLFVLGHVLNSYLLRSNYAYVNASAWPALQTLQSDVDSFFSSSYTTEYSNWQLVTMQPTDKLASSSYAVEEMQVVGWLEATGGSVTPPTPTGDTVTVYKVNADDLSEPIVGATITLYTDAGCTDDYDSGTTYYDGKLEFGVNAGTTYYAKETRAPSGYELNSGCYSVSAGGSVTIEDTPSAPAVSGSAKIRKVDADTRTTTNGSNSVAGAKIGVYQSGTGTQVDMVTIGSDGTGTTGSLPEGTYYLQEITAPTGYITKTTRESWTFTIDSTNSGAVQDFSTSTYSARWIENQLKKGGISITKTRELKFDAGAGSNPLAGVVFEVRPQGGASGSAVATLTTGSDGKASTGSRDLPYGTYDIYEIRGANNEAYMSTAERLVDTRTVGNTDGEVQAVSVTNSLLDDPTLDTEARNKKYSARSDSGATELEISSNAGVIDKVSYDALTPGLLYKLEGELWVMDGGSTYTSPIATKTETWTQVSGQTYVEMDFGSVNTGGLAGKTLSIYQRLYVCNGHTGTSCTGEWIELVRHNQNLTDHPNEQLTVKTYSITTQASSGRGGANDDKLTAGIVTVYDEVKVAGMVNGETYTIKGQLVDKNGNVLTVIDDDGNRVNEIAMTYPMTSSTGTEVPINMELKFDSGALVSADSSEVQTVTVYETLLDASGAELASHKVLGDATQTLEIEKPVVTSTTATSSSVSSPKKLYPSSNATIVDKVEMSGLTPGTAYTLEPTVYEVNLDDSGNKTLGSKVTSARVVSGGAFTTGTSESYTQSVTIELDTRGLAGKTLVVYEKLYYGTRELANHEDVTDDGQTLTVGTLSVETTASSGRGGDKDKSLRVGAKVSINDTVKLYGLTEGETYKIRGELLDEHGETIALTNGDSGNAYRKTSEEFVMELTTGTELEKQMTLEYDSSAFAGKSVTVRETLLDASGNELARHGEAGDADQTLTVETPTIATKAWRGDAVGSSKDVYVEVAAQVSDVVEMTALEPGQKYTLRAELYKLVAGSDGVLTLGDKVAEGSKNDFVAGTDVKTTETVELTVDTTKLRGEKLVVYEYLYSGDTEIARHAKVNDDDQMVTVRTPWIGTLAKDKSDNNNVIEPETGQVIVDTVSYRGLTPNAKYYLTATLKNGTTGETVKDAEGREITKSETKTASSSGESTDDWKMELEIDASEMPGEKLVVFERLVDDQDRTIEIAKHEELNDENQTIKIRPRIGTKAVDKYDSDQKIGVGNVTIVDTVGYEGLEKGEVYKMRGYLVLVDGVKASEIAEAISEVDFTVGEGETMETDGTVKMEFALDTREYAGKKIVVFEELTRQDGTFVAEHKDTDDEDQTVTVMIPKITTTATDKMDADKEMEMNSRVIVVDKVEYEGLVPGTTYVLKGELMDKESKGKFALADGKPADVSYKKFTPDRDKGSVEMEFEFDSTGLSGKEIVVYEELYIMPEMEPDKIYEYDELLESEKTIAEHKDIQSYAQTVWVRVAAPNTGAMTRGLDGAKARGVYAALAGIAIVGTGALVAIRIGRKQKFGF